MAAGAEPVVGDVAIRDGVIVAAGGRIAEPARQEIDADGAIVTPAWVDIHTHYDGQVTWDEEMNPSASHGVGTIVMGNCGVGFAPVPPGGQKPLIELMEGVEDIPGTALHEGMPWGAWETYPEYLDYLATRKYALNVASMIAHGAVRNYVMGDSRGNADATEAEVGRIAAIVEEALRAGAVGFSTSRIMGHRSIHGDQVPGTFAPETELMAIAGAFRRVGAGVMQLIPAGALGTEGEHTPLEAEVEMICRLSAAAGRPATFTLFETFADHSQAHRIIDLVKAGNRTGSRVFPQVGSRPTGFVFSLMSYHPFMAKPSYLALAHLEPAERPAKGAARPRRSRRASWPRGQRRRRPWSGSMEALIPNVPFPMHQTFPLPTEATYEPLPEESFQAQVAEAQGERRWPLGALRLPGRRRRARLRRRLLHRLRDLHAGRSARAAAGRDDGGGPIGRRRACGSDLRRGEPDLPVDLLGARSSPRADPAPGARDQPPDPAQRRTVRPDRPRADRPRACAPT